MFKGLAVETARYIREKKLGEAQGMVARQRLLDFYDDMPKKGGMYIHDPRITLGVFARCF
jgi:hypothetical protein